VGYCSCRQIGGALSKEYQMSNIELDVIVKVTSEKITEADVLIAKTEMDAQVADSAWNMNRRLNMIAYEDQN
jgi:hypothetical protein